MKKETRGRPTTGRKTEIAQIDSALMSRVRALAKKKKWTIVDETGICIEIGLKDEEKK